MTAPRTVVNEGVTKVGYLTVGGNDNDYKLSRPKGPTGTEGGSVVSASASMSYLGALSLPAAQLDSALRDGHTPLSRTALSSQERQPPASLVDAAAAEQARLRRQISHDIHHELSTIMLLASLLEAAPDVGADSRERARQLLGETRWLHQLHLAYEESVVSADSAVRSSVEPVRLDLLAGEVVAAMQLSTLTRIGFTVQEAWAHVDRLAVLADNVVDVCQLDVMFGPETAVDRLGELRRVSPATKVVLLCGRVDEALVVAAQAAASRTSASQSPRFSTCSPGWTPASRRSRRSSWAWRRPVRVERRPTMLSRSRCS